MSLPEGRKTDSKMDRPQLAATLGPKGSAGNVASLCITPSRPSNNNLLLLGHQEQDSCVFPSPSLPVPTCCTALGAVANELCRSCLNATGLVSQVLLLPLPLRLAFTSIPTKPFPLPVGAIAPHSFLTTHNTSSLAPWSLCWSLHRNHSTQTHKHHQLRSPLVSWQPPMAPVLPGSSTAKPAVPGAEASRPHLILLLAGSLPSHGCALYPPPCPPPTMAKSSATLLRASAEQQQVSTE